MAKILYSRDRNYNYTFTLLSEINAMTQPSALLVGFNPEKLKALLDQVQQDVTYAVTTGARLIEPTELASDLLKRTTVDGSCSSNYVPVVYESTEVVSYPVEALCGGISTKMCNSKRADLKSCLARSSTAIEQLRILEQIKDDNRFFKRLWDKTVSGSSADPISVTSLCGPCGTYFKQKMRTLLYCFKVHCCGDMARFEVQHREAIEASGKIRIADFKTVCNHGVVAEIPSIP
jgi:hypothetical protein